VQNGYKKCSVVYKSNYDKCFIIADNNSLKRQTCPLVREGTPQHKTVTVKQ
jgi:hypothetical protein